MSLPYFRFPQAQFYVVHQHYATFLHGMCCGLAVFVHILLLFVAPNLLARHLLILRPSEIKKCFNYFLM